MHGIHGNKIETVLVGGGGHAQVVYSIINKTNNFNIVGYTDLKETALSDKLNFLGSDEVIFKLSINSLIIAVAYGENVYSNLRNKIINKFIRNNFIFPNVIANTSIISDDVKLGKGIQIFHNAIINSLAIIGDFVIINTNAIIEHNVKIGEYTQIAPGSIILGDSNIGSNCFIGAGSIINDSINICDNVIIGSGSSVIKNITEPGVYVGNPVRKIK